jgi:alkylation response protein AidB-like acyl-CoA dehydrogenase
MNDIAPTLRPRSLKPPQSALVAPLDQLRPDESEYQESVAEFCRGRLAPAVRAFDEACALSIELLDALFERGLMGVQVPRSHGGQEHSVFKAILAIEALARVDPSAAVLVHVHNLLVNALLLKFGSDAQQREWLPRLATCEIGAFAVTEPEAGSDLMQLRTEARLEADHYVLRGCKRWITNAREAAVFIVLARIRGAATPLATSMFLVEARAPGVRVSEPIAKLGLKASSACEVVFENVVLPANRMLGRSGAGVDIASYALALGRIGIAAQMTGLAQGALEHAIDYASRREQFGAPICRYQGVSFPLAKAMAEVHAARLVTYNVARKAQAGLPYYRLIEEASGAKLFASHVAEAAASIAVETLGGNGYAQSFLVEKFYRDAKAGKIYEGTTNILLRTLASALMPRSIG